MQLRSHCNTAATAYSFDPVHTSLYVAYLKFDHMEILTFFIYSFSKRSAYDSAICMEVRGFMS